MLLIYSSCRDGTAWAGGGLVPYNVKSVARVGDSLATHAPRSRSSAGSQADLLTYLRLAGTADRHIETNGGAAQEREDYEY